MRSTTRPRRTPSSHGSGARRAGTRLAALLAGLAIALAVGAVGAAPANAEAYAYWGFQHWQGGKWVGATKGAAQVTPKDGAVDGWRYAASDVSSAPRVPRAGGDFDALCGSTPAEAGKKRVGVVLDFGIAAEAPKGAKPAPARGACAVVPTNATSAQVLAAVGDVRQTDQGQVCGIDGYPASGCGEDPVSAPKVPSPEPTVALELPEGKAPASEKTEAAKEPAASSDSADEGGSNTGTIVGVIVAVVIVAGLVFAAVSRSRRRQESE